MLAEAARRLGLAVAVLTACAAGGHGAMAQVTADAKSLIHPAWKSSSLTSTMYLDAALAGKRIVAVGERGTIALSDDMGATWRQARSVPVPAMLTSVYFVDEKAGWAVGHWGVVLKTEDGGETWTLQQSTSETDQPLFSVYFRTPTEGIAVGLWSLMLRTEDGGKTWNKVELPAAPGKKRADQNLFRIFADAQQALYVAGERGALLRSADGGRHWDAIDTGYSGSLWAGIVLHDGSLLVGGLRGTVLRSPDQGNTWRQVPTAVTSSITDFLQLRDGSIIATALDGIELTSVDSANSFKSSQRPDRAAYTAAVSPDGTNSILFTARGMSMRKAQ
ncbi:YCF48-related protein [Comamonas humi]